MQAVVLVGGIGSRLGSLVREVPKPCLEVAGQPFVGHLLNQLAAAGIDEALLLAGYRAEVVERLFPAGPWPGGKMRVATLVEPAPLGTAGALRHAKAWLAEEFLLVNGDSYFDCDLARFLAAAGESAAPCFMALRRVADGSRFGAVELAGNKVARFVEKNPGARDVLINAGLYRCRKELLQRLPAGVSSLERDLFPLLATEGLLAAAEYGGAFIDIGIPEDFARAGDFIRTLAPAAATASQTACA